MKPLVSIIIPVYNAEQYIKECLDSILNQTYSNYEVICVDDGSTDASCNIIKEYCEDPRFRLIQQKKLYAGVARNNGMKYAKGKYLLFLDADDFFEELLIEHTVKVAEEENSDIVVYGARYFDDLTKKYSDALWMVNLSRIPSKIPFSKDSNSKYIFNFTNSCPWNKLYRKDFIIRNSISFQAIERANDLFFTNYSLVKAERISICNEMLVNYRINNANSLQAGNDKTPLFFFEALRMLKERLLADGLYTSVKESFVNLALGNCIYNLKSLKNTTSFEYLYNRLKADIFRELDIDNMKQDDIYDKKQYEQLQCIMKMSVLDYLFSGKKQYFNGNESAKVSLKPQIFIPYVGDDRKVRVVIYAAGNIGKQMYQQAIEQNNMEVVLWVDTHYDFYVNQGFDVSNPEHIINIDYDYIIIAVGNKNAIMEITEYLLHIGVESKKLLIPVI